MPLLTVGALRPWMPLILMALSACGGGGGTSTAPSGGTAAGLNPATTVMIQPSGVEPRDLVVSLGTRVAFMNHDTAFHEISSDPHPTHGNCPEMAGVGALGPGGIGQTAVFSRAATCTYHDHGQSTNAAFQGRIVVR